MTTEMITTTNNSHHHDNHDMAVSPNPVLVIDDAPDSAPPISLLPSLVIVGSELVEDGSDPSTMAEENSGSGDSAQTRTERYERASNNTAPGNYPGLFYPHPNPGPKPPGSSSSSSTSALMPPSPSASTPNSPILSPIVIQGSTNGSAAATTNPLSSLNTSTLVRTISNGSTFGPIPNWPLCVGSQSSSSNVSNHHHPHHQHHPHLHSANVHENGDNHHPHHHANGAMRHSQDPTKSTSNVMTGSGQINVINPSTTSPSSFIGNQHGSSAITTTTSSSTSSKYATSQPNSVPIMATAAKIHDVELKLPLIFGENYVLISPIEASNLFRCLELDTNQEYRCKVVLSKSYYDFLSPHFRMDGHDGINQIQKIIVGRVHTFVLFDLSYGDLHSYVRNERRLTEAEAMPLFKQIVTIVADCHNNGIILRDLKLRKFIFSDEERTQLKLETLEGASMFEDDDTLWDKHGCPAYVSPEIIFSNSFSGLAADCWGMGVILYTMLVGRYPFHDVNPSSVFCKIRRGTYVVPDRLSKNAQCLIRSLMRIDPNERLTAEDCLAHRWFKEKLSTTITSSSSPTSPFSSTILQQSPFSLPNTSNTPSMRSLISNSINSSIILRRSQILNHIVNNPQSQQQQPPVQQQSSPHQQSGHPQHPAYQQQQQPTSIMDTRLASISLTGVYGGPGMIFYRGSTVYATNLFDCPNIPSANNDGDNSSLLDQVVPDLNMNNNH